MADELGDLLFSCVNLVRHCQQDPETVLRACNNRFQQRFNHMEDELNKEKGLENASLSRMDEAWNKIKHQK